MDSKILCSFKVCKSRCPSREKTFISAFFEGRSVVKLSLLTHPEICIHPSLPYTNSKKNRCSTWNICSCIHCAHALIWPHTLQLFILCKIKCHLPLSYSYTFLCLHQPFRASHAWEGRHMLQMTIYLFQSRTKNYSFPVPRDYNNNSFSISKHQCTNKVLRRETSNSLRSEFSPTGIKKSTGTKHAYSNAYPKCSSSFQWFTGQEPLELEGSVLVFVFERKHQTCLTNPWKVG